MTRICVLLILSFSTAHGGWETYVTPPDSSLIPVRASIRYAATPDYGLPTLAEALTKLRRQGHHSRLEVIVVNGGHDADFQREIIEKLQKTVPRELAIALNSGGSTYENPELMPIHEAFDAAVLETATVREINKQLAAVGKRITGASHEKLSFRYLENELVVLFFLYLDVKDG